jgi:hypothetical protein
MKLNHGLFSAEPTPVPVSTSSELKMEANTRIYTGFSNSFCFGKGRKLFRRTPLSESADGCCGSRCDSQTWRGSHNVILLGYEICGSSMLDTYYLHYDGAGAKGWLACLSTSPDLLHWRKKGAVLDFGKPGAPNSRSASYGTTYFEGKVWHMISRFHLDCRASLVTVVRAD